MKKVFILTVLCFVGSLFAGMPGQSTDYGTWTFDQSTYNKAGSLWGADSWDLTQGDITVSFTYDGSGKTAATPYAYMHVGMLNTQGWDGFAVAANSGGAMEIAPVDLDIAPDVFDTSDRFYLVKKNWANQTDYDATGPETIVSAFGPSANYEWYMLNCDRDAAPGDNGTNPALQAGVNTQTGGVCNVEITYHAIDATTGTMFAKINGEYQGTYQSGSVFPGSELLPDGIWPAGLSFSADMTNLHVFAGSRIINDPATLIAGNVTVSQVPEPTTVLLLSLGGVLGLYRKK